jgi:hypothetical protein
MTMARGSVAALIGFLTFGGVAEAQSPKLITQSREWSALVVDGQRGKMCYAIAKPQKMEPASLNHGDVFFFVLSRPRENVRNEPSVQVGYPFRENSKVTVKVDNATFTMFTRNDGAWLENPADEPKLVEAMRKGRTMSLAGTSGRGNPTSYVFPLAGLGPAIDAATKECGR